MVESRFARAVGEQHLFQPGDRALIAVSGGSDSIALLRLMHAHAMRLGITLSIAHVNHGLRGAASLADAFFVEELAGELGLACDTLLAPEGLRSEASLRAVRHRLLRESASHHGCNRIALGHTMDDQAETILMRMMRGAGRRGLSGMLPIGPGSLVRPLLSIRRAALRDWLHMIAQPFREDESNADPRYMRNRVRSQVVPVLESIAPGAVASLARAGLILCEEDRYLDQLASDWLDIHSPSGRESIGISCAALAGLPKVLARRVARLLLVRAGDDPRGRSLAAVEAVLALAGSGRDGASRDLAHGMRLKREGGRLIAASDRCGLLAPRGAHIYD